MPLSESAAHAPTVDDVVAAHAALRARKPLVQAITNTVSTNFMANVLLAAGASPAMVDNPEEAGLFAGIADGVLINLGTPTAAQVESMHLAAAAKRRGDARVNGKAASGSEKAPIKSANRAQGR